MTFSLIPIELNYRAVSFIQPKKFTPEKFTSNAIKGYARQLTAISLVNQEFNQICSKRLEKLKKINAFINKYSKYNHEYEHPWRDLETNEEFDPKGNPQLLDALFTGHELRHDVFTGRRLPNDKSTFDTYTTEIEEDIQEIVKLMPQSIGCILGTLRCRNDVPPLAIACINVNIPLHIIEFLLQQGANPNATLKFNSHPVRIFAHINLIGGSDVHRLAAIKALFIKYSTVATNPK